MSNNENRVKTLVTKSLDTMQVIVVFGIMFIFMSITMPSFLSVLNITNLMKQNAVMMVLGAGMTSVLIVGEIDISMGSVVGLTGSLCGYFYSYGYGASFAAALLIGTLVGFLNGFITTKGKIPAFITTLGTQMMARSVGYVITQGAVVTHFPDGWEWLGQSYVFGRIPTLILVVAVVYAFTYALHKKTAFGQKMYAVGSNRQAAILSGINADWVKIAVMTFCGFCSGLGGILTSSRTLAIQADAGTSLEFYVIAGTVIGGTSMSGGAGNVLLTIVGVFVIGMIRNALNLSHINIYWQNFVTGIVIVAAVLLDSFRRQLQEKMAV